MFSFCVSTSVFCRFCTSWLLDYTSFGFRLFIKACVFVLNPIWVLTISHNQPVMGQKTNDFVSLKHRPGASKTNKKKHSYWFPWVRKQGLIPFYHHARNNATLISYKAPLPSERWIHCCFAFRNLYLCQGGLLNRTFYHQRRSPAAAKCLPAQHSRSNQFEQSGQLIFCIDLLTRDSSQITFLCPVSPKGALGSAAWSRPNSHSDHALYCDYSASSLLSDEIRVCHHKCYLATRSLSACTVKKKPECNKKIATCVQQ